MATLLTAYFCIGIIFFFYVLRRVEKEEEDMTPLMLVVILSLSLIWPVSAATLYSVYRRSLNHDED